MSKELDNETKVALKKVIIAAHGGDERARDIVKQIKEAGKRNEITQDKKETPSAANTKDFVKAN